MLKKGTSDGLPLLAAAPILVVTAERVSSRQLKLNTWPQATTTFLTQGNDLGHLNLLSQNVEHTPFETLLCRPQAEACARADTGSKNTPQILAANTGFERAGRDRP